ncbi:xanthine dehydrogenase family protein molybdopterin-binding subunit [Oceanomicrobium pacificus]|uniref:Molybdopterin-dependent oxidoreductase n=1 Tax=Oceanomicrobium pacificus TaxID=2692916 RepID=A0A6B0TQ56_9RHOB|nr:xanthine dehydrogenase family protein molybdopterin-binding subunit [Oceanomicrobium pacificus]MXU66076.1 molybdopterin-dependent oxidoreductase [Oceanomicrobium pacificus]
MKKFGISQSVRRKEDLRFLTGEGRYVDDIVPDGAAYVGFFRSPVAHAAITHLDVSDAREADGVIGVLTAEDITAAGFENSMAFDTLKNRDGSKAAAPVRPILATDTVRFVGEAVVAIIAESQAQLRDALELVDVDFDDKPVHVDTAVGGTAIHPEAPDNRAFDWSFGDEDATSAAFDGAAFTTRVELVNNRVFAASLEPRGAFAEPEGDRIHLSINGQGVWGTKDELARVLNIDAGQIRITNPDVGGGFGMKAFDYPEYYVTAMAARLFGRAVRWMSERGEALLTDNGARDLVTTAEAAFDADHKLQAVRIHSLSNLGAYNSNYGQFIQTEVAMKVLTGVYDVQTVFFNVEGIYTNTTQIDAYRGAGRPEAINVMERLMDGSARQLGVDGIELRRKNFIPRDAFPYRTVVGELYDVGDFNRVLDRAIAEADIAGFEARKADSAKAGKLRGLGLAYYIESILGDQNETTKIEFAEDGMVDLYVGTQSNGQGHETVFAQILHERAGIPFDKIRFVQGDSDRIAKGGGTGGSRSVTMQGSSINATADIMIDKFRPLAEEELEAAVADIIFEDGAFHIAGTDRQIELIALAEKARAKGKADLLATEHENVVPGRSYPNGAHFAEVEVDPETGVTEVVKYTVVDDFGFLMNPMLAEGQVHGGVAQGIGQALTEQVVYDADGQLLSGTFMDYAMPRADDVPNIPFHAELVPSTANEIGMKGCGEAGTVGALAAVTNAALDAVWELGVRRVDMPLTPVRMWQWIDAAKGAAAAE